MMAPRCASVERHGGVSQTISGPRAVHGKADVGCRLVQEGARSERKRCQGPEISASAFSSTGGMSEPGVLTTLRARGGTSSGTPMRVTREALQVGDSGASFACPRCVWMPWSLKPASKLSGLTSRRGLGTGVARPVHPCCSRSWRLCHTLARGVTWRTLKTWHRSRCPPSESSSLPF